MVYSRVRSNLSDRDVATGGAEEAATMLLEVYADDMAGQFDAIVGALKARAAQGGLDGASGAGVQGCFLTDFRFGTFALKQPKGSKNVIRGQLYFSLQSAE